MQTPITLHTKSYSFSEAIQRFVKEHADDNVRELALKSGAFESLETREEFPLVLNQISGRQTARAKLSSWAAIEGIIYPPHLSMEQCSSEQTARYKAEVLNRLTDTKNAHFIDITGGFGVDFSYLAKGFARCTYIERQELLCDIANHNFPLLGLPHANVVNSQIEEFTETQINQINSLANNGQENTKNSGFTDNFTQNTVLYMDPARRDINGKRTFAISDCTPDLLSFVKETMKVVSVMMVKLSPMLDWHATVTDINRAAGADIVKEVHIVSVANECKELLIVATKQPEKQAEDAANRQGVEVFCVNDGEVFSYIEGENKIITQDDKVTDQAYLLVPNASVMKAGCFDIVAKRFAIKQVASNSHLYISHKDIKDFPGRKFQISAISSLNKKELKSTLSGIEKANISCRNFPMTPEELRKRLKIKDGGSDYIFATTTSAGERLLYVCKKPMK